ncbi:MULTISPECIES: NADH-quinone oxidoreductase subunit NuoF [unclassified Oceanispirochaeta]|uniref:NADH-quinone oxidoreductase subunit NuoF n=1 Tax=unclassified Oceanispirochaeta TaxID=2635722 RepID=UPI000E0909E5|nr:MULTISPECIES: NADH-quinone oxidoreductase subunit NuoF [unclassified Oceanispirochaeta]MBF9014320.1 NADH-quinone oxidoreductase subunit NuoF [Oceanispirochaeta sp. M2]NPD71206.1 NADH-quinone oxidoreductase subunit NuoF [Oceanispirochaeta sp. M1]RDG33593.1 NADH-quinone oxidoreductase subunit NuoF [Oceanispirochaeta sp. M1]
MHPEFKNCDDLATYRKSLNGKAENNKVVRICTGGGCIASGSLEIQKRLQEILNEENLDWTIKCTGCMGPCAHGPVLAVENTVYRAVSAGDLPRLVESHLKNGKILEDMLLDNGFAKGQKKVVLRNCGTIDPLNLDDYLARKGYSSLEKIIRENETGESIIESIKTSGLRGRGGAGFPTWMKWSMTRKAAGDNKVVLCNGDEGDPGAFMDRSVLEGDPHSLIEGMSIAAYAVGASWGYAYVRAEYPLAVARLEKAISQARECGLLGSSVLGSGFSFDIEIRMGSGAFVCGEETALINSIEGKRGEPRTRPPFPAEKGLWGLPSLLNNVETYANIPAIMEMGAENYSTLGTEKSSGTKIFALAGAVNNTGLVEVPIGTPLGDLIYETGGGIKGEGNFKAAQMGGPSGGCIPKEHLNVPMDYDSLKEFGAIMGSGGLIVMDDETCMVDVARFFLEFVQEESCGKCVPCRVGTKRMLEILERICGGEGVDGDIERLIELGGRIQDTALCGLGQTAPNPVLSTIRHFREEYEQHIRDHHCAAGVCPELVRAPCQSACPASVDVPGFVSLIGEGRYAEALKLHRERNPFAAVCARVCFHSCEDHCRRSTLDESVSIRGVKRFMVDREVTIQTPECRENPENELRKIAVVGAGPAGLTCAYFLARLGYRPDIFEASVRPGGMLVQTIPAYRLPRETLAREIRMIETMGASIHTEKVMGRDFTIESLKEDGYQAVFIAVGASESLSMGLPGEDARGIIQAVPYLGEYNMKGSARTGEKVMIIGGGNAAFDAARTAKRLGAESVGIIYRRSQEAMPAYSEEIEDALEEGITLHCMSQPLEFLKDETGDVRAVRCMPMIAGEFDKSGRRKSTASQDNEQIFEADQVIIAIGQRMDIPALFGKESPEQTAAGFLKTDPLTGETSMDNIFAGGDAAEGPSTVVRAIAAGELAAAGIDLKLTGEDHAFWRWEKELDTAFDPDADPLPYPRKKVPALDPQQRIHNFEEVEQSWNEHTAVRQAKRCLRCDYGKNVRVREESHV